MRKWDKFQIYIYTHRCNQGVSGYMACVLSLSRRGRNGRQPESCEISKIIKARKRTVITFRNVNPMGLPVQRQRNFNQLSGKRARVFLKVQEVNCCSSIDRIFLSLCAVIEFHRCWQLLLPLQLLLSRSQNVLWPVSVFLQEKSILYARIKP